MRGAGFLLSMFASAVALSGCVSPEETIYEGVTLEAGDAIAHNSALQIIDPWPPGVQDTDIAVPAERGDDDGSQTDAGDSPQPTV